jgi:trimeric autotransporter adhesin
MTPQKLLINHLSPPSRWVLILLALGGFALCQEVQALDPQTPDPGSVGGSLNTADGTNALRNVTTGAANAAFGWFSLLSNTDGSFNTAVGAATLVLNTADDNTAVGAAALLFNTTGDLNTAVGAAALVNNIDGADNNAVGAFALRANTSGDFNNAHGRAALVANVDGNENNAFGDDALDSNVSGSGNTAIGDDALLTCTGDENVALGDEAGASITSGDFNTCIGEDSGFDITTGSAITAIGPGQSGISSVAGQINDATYISNVFAAGVDGASALPVLVDADGKLGNFAFSSQRYKKEIRPMGQTSEAVLALKPVKFQYKNDNKGLPQFGLIAEEVAKVNPDLVVRDKKGEIVAVNYNAVNAMLLNEFLKEHEKVQKLEAQLKEQAAQIQKVSAQLEVSKPAPQVVTNKP